MKTAIFAITLGLIIIFSVLFAFIGAGIMVYDVYSGGPNFMMGFNMFSLSSILFFVSTIAYISTKILTNTEVISEVLAKYFEDELAREESQSNQIRSIFNGPGMMETQIIRFDEQGPSIVPSHDDLMKRHQEMVARVFGETEPKEATDRLNIMSVSELQAEEKKAIDTQNFELAAVIRDLINKKTI